MQDKKVSKGWIVGTEKGSWLIGGGLEARRAVRAQLRQDQRAILTQMIAMLEPAKGVRA